MLHPWVKCVGSWNVEVQVITTLIFLFNFLTDSVKEKNREETWGIDKEKKMEEIMKSLWITLICCAIIYGNERKSKPQLWNISCVPNASIVYPWQYHLIYKIRGLKYGFLDISIQFPFGLILIKSSVLPVKRAKSLVDPGGYFMKIWIKDQSPIPVGKEFYNCSLLNS